MRGKQPLQSCRDWTDGPRLGYARAMKHAVAFRALALGAALIGLLGGDNRGKRMVRVGSDPE